MRRAAPDDIDSLERFVTAQDGIYDDALSEIVAGAKRGHWMWFVFPQLRGLGRSPASRYYGIADRDEARRYLAHRILGPRLIECAEAALTHRSRPAADIFGGIDAAKLRSSATLFAATPAAPDAFADIVSAFFDGRPCPITAERLG